MAINILGSNRKPLFEASEQELDTMRKAHVMVTDPRRTRPKWFDGRFLAARDLANEQNYFLVRQTDLGRAGGTGVIEGLMLMEVSDPKTQSSQLRIEAGYGFSDTGEMVVVPENLDINPSNIPETQRLDAAFGLQKIPSEPGRSRTGLYVVALRPVEWTANPTSAYPTSLTGERTVQDGDIIEGIVVSLIPWADDGSDDWESRRARVAKEIFLNSREQGQASGTLPLGIVALRANQIVWVDPYLVRRDAGAERPSGIDFGFGKRALREAQLLQYNNHLVDVLNTLNGKGFEAAAWFDTLPPVGRMPSYTIDASRLTHKYFPPSMTVEFAFVPEDEIPALIEESLLLPPIDLEASVSTLSGTGVIILAPMQRSTFSQFYQSLGGRTIKLSPAVREIKGIASRLDFSINYQRNSSLADFGEDGTVVEAGEDWKNLIVTAQQQKLFWYVRRRHLPTASNLAGVPVSATDPESYNLSRLSRFLNENPAAKERWESIRKSAGPEARLLLNRFAETRFLNQPQVIKSLLIEATAIENANPEEILKALAPVANPDLGKGLTLIASSDASLARSLSRDAIAGTGVLTEVDRLVREIPEASRKDLVAEIKDAAKKPATLAKSVNELKMKYKGTQS
jgi:hypothetical protein